MKHRVSGWVLAGTHLFLLWGGVRPVWGQHVICCSQLVDVRGNWIGASGTCDLGSVPSGERAKICQQLAGCPGAAPYCGVNQPCTVSGSIVDVQNQALDEAIRISGTPFSLYYRSDRDDGFPNSLAGWSIDVHHAYDSDRRLLYGGDGRRRIAGSTGAAAGGEIRVPSRDATVVFAFDGRGRHLRTADALTGAVAHRFAYDGAGRLSRLEDGYGNVTRIDRDAKGVSTGIVAPGGQRTALAVNAGGLLSSVTNPAGEISALSYSKEGRLSTFTAPKGQMHRFTYSSAGLLLKAENPAGGHWTLARSETAGGFKVALTSALGRTATYETDRLSASGERMSNTGPGGAAVRVEKGKEGRERVIQPDGTVSVSELQPDPRWGDLAPLLKSFSLSTPGGRKLALLADRKAVPATPGDAVNLRTLTESLTINGREYTESFDAGKKMLVRRSPAGREIFTTLDRFGRTVREEIAGFFPVLYAYDPKGRLSGVVQGTAGAVRSAELVYDSEGRLAGVTDPLKHAMRFEHDRAGRVTKRILADGREVRYVYDGGGNLTEVSPPSGVLHRFEYTAADQPQTYTAPAVSGSPRQTGYAYNRDKQLIRLTRPEGTNIGLQYDKAGRISALVTPREKVVYSFDAATNHLTSITATNGGKLSYEYDGFLLTKTTWSGTIDGIVTRVYDDDFRIASVAVNGRKPIENQYDPDGLLVRVGALTLERHPKSGLVTATRLGNVTTTHAYNGYGELERSSAAFDDKEVFAVEYERDSTGRIIKKTETVQGQTSVLLYGYDPAGQLVKAGGLGSRETTIYEYDANGNRLAHRGARGDSRATYDAEDRLVAHGGAKYRYGASGELAESAAGGKSTVYDYDIFGNLRSATAAGAPKIEYVHDGANRRVGRKVNGKLVQAFLYGDRLKPVAELDGGGNVVAVFAYATRVNMPEYVEKSDGVYRIVTDHLGSPRLVINVETGAVAQRMDFDEFGNVLQDTRPGFQPFGFAGGIYDPWTKLTRFGARDYDASTARWTAMDPIGFGGGDVNLYRYVGNDPINRTDPRGLQEVDVFGIWEGDNWSDPVTTTIVEVDSAGNVTWISPSPTTTNAVDFPFIVEPPAPIRTNLDRIIERLSGKGWTLYNEGPFRFTFKPGIKRDQYGRDAPGGMCNDPWTNEQRPQNPSNRPPASTSVGGTIRWHF